MVGGEDASTDQREQLDGVPARRQPVGGQLPLGVGAQVVDRSDTEPGEGDEIGLFKQQGVASEIPVPIGCGPRPRPDIPRGHGSSGAPSRPRLRSPAITAAPPPDGATRT